MDPETSHWLYSDQHISLLNGNVGILFSQLCHLCINVLLQSFLQPSDPSKLRIIKDSLDCSQLGLFCSPSISNLSNLQLDTVQFRLQVFWIGTSHICIEFCLVCRHELCVFCIPSVHVPVSRLG